MAKPAPFCCAEPFRFIIFFRVVATCYRPRQKDSLQKTKETKSLFLPKLGNLLAFSMFASRRLPVKGQGQRGALPIPSTLLLCRGMCLTVAALGEGAVPGEVLVLG